MPGLQTLLNELNNSFSRQEIEKTATKREAFAAASGDRLPAVLLSKDDRLHPLYRRYLKQVPGAIQAALRATISHAMGDGSRSPIQINFTWVPAFDYGIKITHVPDTKETKGGITVIIESPYDKPGSRSKK